MRKQLLILALLAAITLTTAIKPAAADPHVEGTPKWLKPVFSGTDIYHDDAVVAYEAGSTAKFLIRVHNDYAAESEIKVKVFMDWMTSNVSSEEVTVEGGQYHTFEISIPIPATSEASNMYLHSYMIYYEYTTTATPPVIIRKAYGGDDNFAVYSTDQTEIVDVKRELAAIGSYSATTAKARELLIKARIESSLGEQMYDKGEFASALTNYNNALNYTHTGISADIEKSTIIEDSYLGVRDSLKGALSMFGYGSLLFGIGFLFIGIGVIIYAMRKPRPSMS